jgi:hypothetical protein
MEVDGNALTGVLGRPGSAWRNGLFACAATLLSAALPAQGLRAPDAAGAARSTHSTGAQRGAGSSGTQRGTSSSGTPRSTTRAHPETARAVAETTISILSFSRWPDNRPVVRLCVVGVTRYVDGLLTAHSAWPRRGHRVSVRQRAPIDVATDCDALYLGVLPEQEARAVYRRIDGEARLTISERREACRDEGMFCLEVRDRKVAFAVNLHALARSGVRVHPAVLQLGQHAAVRP